MIQQERQSKLLRGEIESVLASLPRKTGLYDLVKEPLTRARRGLAVRGTQDRPWPLLPLMVCEAICQSYEEAVPAAAAFEFLKAAADVFDDIEDADSSESLLVKHGSALATNAATCLLILAEKSITRLRERGVPDRTIVCTMDTLNSYYTTACAGQHLDLSLKSTIDCSEDIYLKIIDMKSASQVECACHIGALLANADKKMVDLFRKFGHNLGMATQITNDIHGVIRGIDISKRAVTLPVIFALTQADDSARSQIRIAFSRPSESQLDTGQIKDLLFRIGAVHYATIKLEFYKQQALELLSKAGTVGASIEPLKIFLS